MTSKFGLGRGLADLQTEMGNVPEISVLAGGERVVVRQIPLNQIERNIDQPRKIFDGAELEDLAKSIKEKGVLQPILVRSIAANPARYQIVAGERRYRAARDAGLSEIPALVKNFSDTDVMEVALIENVQRENLTPIEEALAYENLIKKAGYTTEDLGNLVGKSVSHLRNTMRLLGLPESVKRMVENGELSAGHARTLTVSEDAEEIARRIIADNLTVRDTEIMVKKGKRSSKSRPFQSNLIADDIVREYSKRVGTALGAKVSVRSRKGGAGDIIIHTVSRAQMAEIVDKLSNKGIKK